MATHCLIWLLLAFSCSFSILFAETSRKELRTKQTSQDTVIQLGRPSRSNKINPSRAIQLSWQPRIFLYRGFLSDEECDHLISLGHGTQKDSVSIVDDLRKDKITASIEEKISAWTFLPAENGKPINVMHFGPEDIKQTYDYFGSKSPLLLSEPIMATVILYLSNVSQGGQILFPASEPESSHVNNIIWSDCTKSSNAVRPTKGNAILFFNVHPNASPDKTSSHSRCPVIEDDMWCATKFFHLKTVGTEKVDLRVDNSDCADEDESCPKWAAIGECQRNPVFMIGSPDYYGTCRKSCNAC